ncbi:CoA ester lyase [Seongchinamella sediminis]|uniref:CoA ester lyase n=1 Tax=Seongchinamella sediminis TaxID=2283635 RepID=A0A3L7DZG7_9GAMM|nr:CoA ester lyase [Seongchinamella sediminis]RLQ21381.1 CoA ester lyase [Seongchinamella sediminis]
MNKHTSFRPRRSLLYMPGANTRALEKARTLPADMLVFDLEDAVAPDAKVAARESVAAALRSGAFGYRELLVRINALESEWGRADMDAALAAAPDGILLPKVATAAQVRAADQLLRAAGSDAALWAMIETPLAILNIAAIAATAQETRLAGFVVGTNDLAKELNAETDPGRSAFQVHLALTLAAARAHGLVAIDGVYNDFRDADGLAAECEQGRLLGFDGKSLIHPAQLETANRVFAPTPQAVSRAQAIVDAFARAENAGKGVIELDGRMVELLHREQAEQVIAIARAIDETGGS